MIRYLVAFLLVTGGAFAECCGKVDVAPVFLKVDLLKYGKEDQTYNMQGARGAIDYLIWKLKPLIVRFTGLSAWGKHNSHFQTYTAGLGACIPYQQFLFTPTVGVTYCRFTADDGKFPPLEDLKQTFDGLGPYIGIDIQWRFCDTWKISGGFQYSWSHTHAFLKDLFSNLKDNSKGPTWTLQIEKDITEQWSLNIAGAYNRSLNHEKHGLKAQGVKVGLTYWF